MALDPLEHEEVRARADLLHSAVAEAAANVARQREHRILALPAGYRLCAHEVTTRGTVEPGLLHGDDTLRWRVSQQVHTLKPGETCQTGGLGPRTEYKSVYDAYPPLTVNRLTARFGVTDGTCPDCGKPAAHAEVPYVRVHHDQADHAACPAVVEATRAAKVLAEAANRLLELPVDVPNASWATVAVDPGAFEDPPPDLLGKIHQMYRKLIDNPDYRDEPRTVRPDVLARHREVVADPLRYPRAEYLVVRWRGQLATNFLRLEPVGTYAPGVDPWGSLWGRSLFRTGEYVVRPDATTPTGFAVAEIMESE